MNNKELLAKLQGSKQERQAARIKMNGNSGFKFFVAVNGWQYDRNNIKQQTGDLLFLDEATKEHLNEIELLERYPNSQLFFIVPASSHVKNKKNE